MHYVLSRTQAEGRRTQGSPTQNSLLGTQMSRFSKLYLAMALPLALSGCGYNTIQRFDEQAAQSKQQIDVQLQRRADLVPNLVATVKGYAKQEETIFIEVARARSGLLSAIQSG